MWIQRCSCTLNRVQAVEVVEVVLMLVREATRGEEGRLGTEGEAVYCISLLPFLFSLSSLFSLLSPPPCNIPLTSYHRKADFDYEDEEETVQAPVKPFMDRLVDPYPPHAHTRGERGNGKREGKGWSESKGLREGKGWILK